MGSLNQVQYTTDMASTRGYWVVEKGRGELRDVALPEPTAHELVLAARRTGISPGTERLVGLGLVPTSCREAMACRGMQGSFALPVLYGYSFVGRVAHGEHVGRRAFVMRPHQDRVVVRSDEVVWLPEAIPDDRATLFPNVETAQNAVWDGELLGEEPVAVVGAGALGLLVAFVLSRQHRGTITVVERDAARRTFAASLPWIETAVAPDELPPGSVAHAFHASASEAGLQLAIDAVGFEGRVIELSWYGERAVTLRLGGTFHSERKQIRATQVGYVAPRHRPAGHPHRTQAVLDLLHDQRLDRLVARRVSFAQLPDFFADLYAGAETPPCPVVEHSTVVDHSPP
jgi:threonine dehydrogenase-like Zn-dependent dehydrogenase